MEKAVSLTIQGRERAKRAAEIFLLSTAQFEHYWPNIEGLLDLNPSLWETFNTKESIYDKVCEGQYQVWVVCDGEAGPITTVFFTEILQFERGRDLHLFWSYGVEALRAPECVEAAVETFARHHDCEALMLTGRRGWERVLKPLGWQFEAVVLRKPIDLAERRH